MKVSEQIAIMIAYQDLKTIEQKRFDRTEWESIVYDENFQFNFAEYEYRIKPVTKYRPYESVDEAFKEAEVYEQGYCDAVKELNKYFKMKQQWKRN